MVGPSRDWETLGAAGEKGLVGICGRLPNVSTSRVGSATGGGRCGAGGGRRHGRQAMHRGTCMAAPLHVEGPEGSCPRLGTDRNAPHHGCRTVLGPRRSWRSAIRVHGRISCRAPRGRRLRSPRAAAGGERRQSPGGGWRRVDGRAAWRLAAGGRIAGTEAPEGTGGDLRSTGPVAANKSAVPDRRRVPRSPALRPANLVPGTVPRIAPRTGLAVQPAPSGKTKCTTQGRATTRRLSTNVRRDASDLSPNLAPLWTGCGYTHRGGVAWVVGSLD